MKLFQRFFGGHFDKTGQLITPSWVNKGAEPNSYFGVKQPGKIDYGERLANLARYFQCESGELAILFQGFEQRVNQRIGLIRRIRAIRRLLKGPYFSLLIPRVTAMDYGQAMKTQFLPALKRAWQEQFPDRTKECFVGKVSGKKCELPGQVEVVTGSGHELLVAMVQKGVVEGTYFPDCLRRLSVEDSRKLMKELSGLMKDTPLEVSLAGGIDTISAMVMYPDKLLNVSGYHRPPGFNLAALRLTKKYSLRLTSSVNGLVLWCADYLDYSFTDCSSGLLFILPEPSV